MYDFQDFVYTGPSTIAGQYLRRFWHPVFVSAELKAGQLIPIRIMGEELLLYRGETGKVHVTQPLCPHRLTRLVAGWVEGDGVRCMFHGWKFDETGACVEQPAEPKSFCEKIRIATYPADEYLGLVFVYLGEAPCPPMWRWPELEEKPFRRASRAMLPCNYFQSAENIVDDVHVAWAHRSSVALGTTPRASDTLTVTACEREFGLLVTFEHPTNLAHVHYVMPNSCYIEFSRRNTSGALELFRVVFWYVPIDDEHHLHIRIDSGSSQLGPDGTVNVADTTMRILEGRSVAHRVSPSQAIPSELVRIQDGVSVVGQGAIVDRRFERLGTSDAGVILLRKLWRRELRALRDGQQLTQFARPEIMGPGEVQTTSV
jgi:5,5'-dehydrodivanillate O-demethylase